MNTHTITHIVNEDSLKFEIKRKFALVAVLSIGLFIFLSPSVEASVYFADANLKAAVEAELGVTDPTPTDMLALMWLSSGSNDITALTGLEYAVNLTELGLCETPKSGF